MENAVWPTAVVGEAGSVNSVSASACYIGWPKGGTPRYPISSKYSDFAHCAFFSTEFTPTSTAGNCVEIRGCESRKFIGISVAFGVKCIENPQLIQFYSTSIMQ